MKSLSHDRALNSMDFSINNIQFEYKLRLIKEFKTTYARLKEVSGNNNFRVTETTWNCIVEHYFSGTNNNYIIIEDMGADVDMLSVPDYLHRVLISMFKQFPTLINGKDTIFQLFPSSDKEWCVATYSGIMRERYDGEVTIDSFWRRISSDEDILASAKNLLFEVEL